MSTLSDYIYYTKRLAQNGGPYAPWDFTWPPSPGPPFYMDSGDYSYAYIQTNGANCSGFLNIELWWVGLKAVGGTQAWGDLLLRSGGWYETYKPGKLYPTGTFLLQPYGTGVGGEGHIAVVVDGPSGTIAQADTYYGLNMQKTADQQHYYTPWSYAAFHPQLIPEEAGGNPNTPLGKYDYPGDCADPAPVARYMARVARDKYDLPPELPVMASYVEMTGAWTSPGCLENVPGYYTNQDFDSLGYWQMRPSQGWGSYEQVTDAAWALDKFCQVATDKWRNVDPNDAEALGEWCADIERPREDLRYLYASKGYPAAKELIKGWDTEYGDDKPEPDPDPGPGPRPEPEGELRQWEKWGWYQWPSDDSWDLQYVPPEGRTSPLPDPEPQVHKARTKPEEVEYYEKDGKYVVMLGEGSEITYSENEFKQKYEELS